MSEVIVSAAEAATVADDHAVCRLRLIGPMEAWASNGESVLPIGRKTRAMLAIIALSAPRPILRSRLADLLWSRRHEEQARASLRQELHRLLEALQPIGTKILDVTRDHVVLRPGLVWVDVHQVLHATAADFAALTLIEGELLEEFDDVDPALDHWLTAERNRLRDQARDLAEAVLGAQAGADHAIPAAQRLLSIDRSHEGAWRALMQGYAARGERGKAIQAYEQCRGVLTDLLDAAPLPDTQRLAAEIRAGTVSSPVRSPETAEPPTAQPRVRRVKIGALPPQAISAGPEERQFSLGVAEEVTVALARFGGMAVVSSSSLAQFSDRSEAAIRAAFGVDLLLAGSLQRAGRRLRITLRLLDLRDSSKVVWVYRTDRQLGDLLTLQDDVAAEVASQVDLEVQSLEAQRAASAPADRQTAQDMVACAIPLMTRLRREEHRHAGELLDAALTKEPDSAHAHAWKAWWLLLGLSQGWVPQAYHAADDAAGHAARAIALDARDARVLTIAAHVRATIQHLPAEALDMHARALLLNPNLAMAWGLAAIAYLYNGDLDEAERHFATFRRLSPSDPHAFVSNAYEALLELFRGRDDVAASLGRRATELHPSYLPGLKHYLAVIGHTQRAGDAQPVLARVMANDARFSVQAFLDSAPFTRASDRQLCATGLRRAGVPDSEVGALKV